MLKVSLEQWQFFMLFYQLHDLLDTEIYSFVWYIIPRVGLYLEIIQYIRQGMWRGCITENTSWTHSHVFFSWNRG